MEHLDKAIRFFVPGVPAPGGSKKAFAHARTGKIIVQDTCKRNKPWRAMVAHEASLVCRVPLQGPIMVAVTFYLPRPKIHYGTGKNRGELKGNAPYYHVSKPDATKLWRAAEDALKGICWLDDSQVAIQMIEKQYANGAPGAAIAITKMEQPK